MSENMIGSIAAELEAEEVWEVTTFTAYVKGRELLIEIHDSHEAGSGRFFARATDPRVPPAERDMNSKGLTQGNAASTVREAVSNLHMWIFRED